MVPHATARRLEEANRLCCDACTRCCNVSQFSVYIQTHVNREFRGTSSRAEVASELAGLHALLDASLILEQVNRACERALV